MPQQSVYSVYTKGDCYLSLSLFPTSPSFSFLFLLLSFSFFPFLPWPPRILKDTTQFPWRPFDQEGGTCWKYSGMGFLQKGKQRWKKKREREMGLVLMALFLLPIHDHSFQANIFLSHTQLNWGQFYSASCLIPSSYFLNRIKPGSKLPVAKGWEIKIPSLQGLPPFLPLALEATCSLQYSGRASALLNVQAYVTPGSGAAPLFPEWWDSSNGGETPRLRFHPEDHHTRYCSRVMLIKALARVQGCFPYWDPPTHSHVPSPGTSFSLLGLTNPNPLKHGRCTD